MTDQTATTGTNPPTPDTNRLLAELVGALTRDAELRSAQMERLDALIAMYNQKASADAARRDKVVRDLEQEFGAEHERTQRAKWYTGVFGLIAVIVGVVLFYWIFEMVEDMNRMEDYMYNMGHGQNDDRPALEGERKVIGMGYMDSMADNMQTMREDIGAMRLAMTRMDAGIGHMSGDMGAMRADMGAMSRDMTTMSATMALLRHDTTLLSIGVGGMSNDTRSMGAPFRAMDSLLPW